MKLDYKKILKVLGTGVGAIAVVKLMQGFIAEMLMSSDMKEKIKVAREASIASKVKFDIRSARLTEDELKKWAMAQANALMAASAIVIFLAHKFLKQADMKIAAWAGAGFPVALGLSGLVDNTGKLAGMFAIEATNVATGKASAAGGYQVKGDNRPITIPAAQIVDYIKARQQSAEVQGHMQNVAAAALNGDDESIHNIAQAFMAGDDDGDAAADYVSRLDDEAA